ncbi:MAG TPA: RNA polymerase sigma factor [Terriglobales bacterium]|nr:RNA polymerase sigma factor [Terriglobales bacterium]
MQAADAYIGSEQHIDVPKGASAAREMEDLSCHLPSFYMRAYRFLGNVADAEDAVQDALLSAHKHLDQFRGQSQMSTWLTAIVSNSARMQLRRRPRQIHMSLDERIAEEQEYPLSERLAHRGPTPEDEYRNSELNARLRQLAEQLSPPLRKAFQLRDLDGLTTNEAARILGVANGTVKAQLARARAKLRRLMRPTLNAQPRSALTCGALPVIATK